MELKYNIDFITEQNLINNWLWPQVFGSLIMIVVSDVAAEGSYHNFIIFA